MNAFDALYNFWAGFGWDAYDENTVPDGDFTPDLPYITYNAVVSNFDEPVMMHAILWDRNTSWKTVTQKAEEINKSIGLSGRFIKYDDGILWIKRGAPFMQRMADKDSSIRRLYIVVEAEYLTNI